VLVKELGEQGVMLIGPSEQMVYASSRALYLGLYPTIRKSPDMPLQIVSDPSHVPENLTSLTDLK
jgi:hypothetical protein